MDARRKILMIDDEKDFCLVIKMNLELLGRFTVSILNHPKEAPRMAKKVKPDIILLDINMPEMSGFDVLKKLKEDQTTMNIPVVMLSARADDDSKLKASQLYNELYLTKPIEAQELIAKIEEILKYMPPKI